MTPEQRELLEDKLQLWKRAAKEGNMELRDYNRRCAEALEAALNRPTPGREEARECPLSYDGRHQVDTSMESGPNNCFHCDRPMQRGISPAS